MLGNKLTQSIPEETGKRVHSLPTVPGFEPWLKPDIDRFDWNPFDELRRARPGSRRNKLFSALRAAVIYDIRRGVLPETPQSKDTWIENRILGIAFQLNQTNPCPLNDVEVRNNIAKSIAGYYFADQLDRSSRKQRGFALFGHHTKKRKPGEFIPIPDLLKEKDARDQSIILRLQNGESGKSLAKEYKLTQQAVSKIICKHRASSYPNPTQLSCSPLP